MSKNARFLSPISLSGPYVVSSEFWTSDSAPKNGVRCDIGVDVDDGGLVHEDGAYLLSTSMAVTASLIETDGSGEDGDEKARMLVAMVGTVHVEDAISDDEELVYESLKMNAVSMFYASARGCIEQMTAMSPMQRFTIPAIDPKALLDSIAN